MPARDGTGYRELGPNVAGNMSSWGLYFLLDLLAATTKVKCLAIVQAPSKTLSTSPYTLQKRLSESSSFLAFLSFLLYFVSTVTAILTNPM